MVGCRWVLPLILFKNWSGSAVVAGLAPPSPRLLQSPHPIRSPAETLRDLADCCDRLGIDSFDVYGDFHLDKETSFLRDFEADIAKEFGKEDAVFMPSGVMAQSIALLIHQKRENHRPSDGRRKFACHWSSHLLLHEQEGYRQLCQLDPVVLPLAKNEDSTLNSQTTMEIGSQPLSLSEIEQAVEDGSLRSVDTLILELPHREIGGKCTSWDDIDGIGKLLAKEGIAFHCDGARIFEATSAYGKSLADLVAPFDSVYISFYKGLGGLAGAMLLGSSDFCNEARLWLRRFGGNLYTLLPYVVSGMDGYKKYWKRGSDQKSQTMSFEQKRDKLARIVSQLSESCSDTMVFDPPVPEVNMIHCYFKQSVEACCTTRDNVKDKMGIKLFRRLQPIPDTLEVYRKGFRCRLELTLGEQNGRIPDESFVDGWNEFCALIRTS